ncbi:MAG: amino acid ABC transporter permease [Rhodoferax sp.]
MDLSINYRVIGESWPDFWAGFTATVGLCAVGFAGALAVGILACAMSMQRHAVVRRAAMVYVDLIRATPLLAQLYFLYFGLPVLGLTLPERVVGIVALSINSGAYVAEIIRSGILGIPRGQLEAAAASGMTYGQQMRLIILPQALHPMVSPLIGQGIVLVKDSSLLSLISVLELTRVGQTLAQERFMPIEGLVTTAALYLLIYYGLKLLAALWRRGQAQRGFA